MAAMFKYMAIVLISLIMIFSMGPILTQFCNGEVVYVTSTPPPNPDCPDGLQCQTLQHYFNNESFTEEVAALVMVFLIGEHAGVCKQTVLQSNSFNITGVGQGVTINCTIIELKSATAIYFENVKIDHWYVSSLRPPVLVFKMSSVIAQNKTHFYIEHNLNVSGNLIGLNNCTYKNSILSGELYFIGGEGNASAMTLVSSTLNIGNNTYMFAMDNSGVVVLVNSTMNVGRATSLLLSSTMNISSIKMTFISNTADAGGAIRLLSSTMNIGNGTNMTFINNVGGAIYLLSSTMNVGNGTNMTFINNTADIGGAISLQSSTVNIGNGTNMTFINFINFRNVLTSRGAINLQSSTMNVGNNTNMTFISFIQYALASRGAISLQSSTNNVGNDTNIMTFISSIENIPKVGGAINLQSSTMNIKNSTNMIFINNYALFRGGAIRLLSSTLNVGNCTNMTFINNVAGVGGAISLESSTMNVGNGTNMTFINNHALAEGGAISLKSSAMNVGNGTDMTFINNVAESGGAINLQSSTMNVGNYTNITFINNIIDLGSGRETASVMESAGGAMLLFSSTLIISTDANITFINNSAQRGGAIALIMSSVMIGKVNMIYENNSALEYGGAIYVDPDLLQQVYNYDIRNRCFYHNETTSTLKFWFLSNKALIAGDDVYGASLRNWCQDEGASVHTNSGTSSISSVPSRICKCDEDNLPQCKIATLFKSIFPGETFTITVVPVGGDWGTTPGSAFANIKNYDNISIQMPSSQFSQWINTTQCTALNYTVYSSLLQSIQLMISSYKNINLYYLQYCQDNSDILKSSGCAAFSPLYINLNLLPCPPGFSLQRDPPKCDCYPVLTSNGLKCTIVNTKVSFSWSNKLWINITTNETFYSENCPFDYCKDVKTIEYIPDNQCAFNHAGRLCGSCKENYSLAIGSSHCIYCPSNNKLALLIFFAAVGFLLVLFISILNLTVTQGLINGVIFYANIVWSYQSILFPKQMHNELVVFKTFIAWLNLDFGIETCFINGLNAFGKTWLQFVFPFYIWSIAGLMIFMARQSTRLTNLFGNRAVPVLATLILLSYTKLLRAIMEALEFSIIYVYYERNNTTSTTVVWSVDGTLDYLGYPHILLFVASLFSLLFLWLPYTLLLLLIQWIQRISHLRFLKWTMRLSPFYDVHFAPLKPGHQYWFGALLLTRGILLVTFASTLATPQAINLLILLVFSGVLLFYMILSNPYKSHTILAAQSFYFINLSLLCGLIFFSYSQEKAEQATETVIVGASTGVVFLQFCGIILYSIYKVCCSYAGRVRRNEDEVRQYNIQQADAILEINARPRYVSEKQPLLQPSDDRDVPTY